VVNQASVGGVNLALLAAWGSASSGVVNLASLRVGSSI